MIGGRRICDIQSHGHIHREVLLILLRFQILIQREQQVIQRIDPVYYFVIRYHIGVIKNINALHLVICKPKVMIITDRWEQGKI